MEEKPVNNNKGDGLNAGAATELPVSYDTSVHCEPSPLPAPYVLAVQNLERVFEMPVFGLIQRDERKFAEIDWALADAVINDIRKLPKGKPIALLMHSPGGQASCAYRLALRINQHCGSFVALVPRWAKSAATLLSLGASRIVLGSQGELGPLDAQVTDFEERMICPR